MTKVKYTEDNVIGAIGAVMGWDHETAYKIWNKPTRLTTFHMVCGEAFYKYDAIGIAEKLVLWSAMDDLVKVSHFVFTE